MDEVATRQPAGRERDDRPEPPTAVVETHLSRVFLSPDRVFKQLKAVTTSFVDLSDRNRRLRAAAREFELNHRISPDVYLGSADVVEDGELADRLIVMRRLPAARRLDRLLDQPDLDDRLREVARFVAAVHAGQPPERGPAAAGASRAALAANWADAVATLEPLVGPILSEERHLRLRALVDGYLDGRGPLFAERVADGWVRDGHGDLRAEHVFCLDDGPRLIDCLAFRDDLRIGDVLADVAFLAMDLHRLAGPAAALALVRHYAEFAAERHPSSLAHHYVAYRAMVRAKVAAVRLAQGSAEAAVEVVDDHELALQHLLLGQVRLVVVGGGAGVGKTTVAAGVADAIGAVLLRADEVRKNLAGLSSADRAAAPPGRGLYEPSISDGAYREMLHQAELLLERGESVVLDATWSAEHRRRWARDLAAQTSATITEIECQAPLAVAKERIVRRSASVDDPSDATPEVAEFIAARFEPWDEADVVTTTGSIRGSVSDACRVVIGSTGPAGPAGAAASRSTPTGTPSPTGATVPSDRVGWRGSGGTVVGWPATRLPDLVLSRETVEFFLTRIAAWERSLAADRHGRRPTGQP